MKNSLAWPFLKCFFRTFFIGAAFNTRGLQNIGLIYALDPGLKALYTQKEDLIKARKRYIKLHNCHPFWTPLLVGIFLFLEHQLSRKIINLDFYNKTRPTVVYTLSALGDSFFGGSLLPFWAILTTIFLVLNYYAVAFWFSFSLFWGLQFFKLYTFFLSLKNGFSVLSILKKWNLINWGQYLKLLNSGLLLILISIIFPYQFNFWIVYTGFIISILLTLIFKNYIWFRELFIIIFYVFLICYYYFK